VTWQPQILLLGSDAFKEREAAMKRLQEIGERDTQIQLLRAGIQALGPVDKARKWLITPTT